MVGRFCRPDLGALAALIKEHTLTHLDQYLDLFEANATKLGMHERTIIVRHIKVVEGKSPFDGGLGVLGGQTGLLSRNQPASFIIMAAPEGGQAVVGRRLAARDNTGSSISPLPTTTPARPATRELDGPTRR